MMNILGNIVWWILGGIATALEYFSTGLVLCLTIIGIPFGLQCFKLGLVMLFPFGSKIGESKGGALSFIGNILWLIPGVILAFTHILFGLLLCITIIGIPWGQKHFKFAKVAFSPFGREIKVNL